VTERETADNQEMVMYTPKHFLLEDRERINAFIEQNNFATLVTVADGLPVANHFPFAIETTDVEIRLLAHMARANSQWRHFNNREVLVIFQGPNAYVSPSNYETRLSVPTWNYTAVHFYGLPQIIDDSEIILKKLIAKHEPEYNQQWHDLPEDYQQKMLNAIVGFEIKVIRIEAKFKLSQNRTSNEQARITEGLTHSNDSQSAALAELMKENLK
jgi:transcriptional regulator